MVDLEKNDGIMIAYLPRTAEWCRQDLAHLTLVYAGKIGDHQASDFNAMAKDVAMLGLLTRPFALPVAKLSVFGEEEKVDVLEFRSTPELDAARRAVYRWNASQWPFKPHSTIGPAQPFIDIRDFPRIVAFDRIMIAWGEDKLVFNLSH